MDFLKRTAVTSQRFLAEEKFSVADAGSIIADAEAMLAFIGPKGLVVKSRNGNLPAEVLPELNTRLAAPITLALKCPLLRDYPNLGGVFVLLRVMDLVRAKGTRMEINPAALTLWHGLNATEKYFALLEAWLWRASAEVLGGESRRRQSQFVENLGFLLGLRTGTWTEFPTHVHTYERTGHTTAWNAQLQMRFGLAEVKARTLAKTNGQVRQAGRGWTLEQARRTPWGQAFAWALTKAVVGEEDVEFWQLDPPEKADFGFLQATFRPYFPDWEQLFKSAPEGKRAGLHVFKATMTDRRAKGTVWRRLSLPGGLTLDALAYGVLKSFDFDAEDHLYEFSFRDRRGKTRWYFHEEMEEGPFAHEVTLAELNLPDRAEIAFRFDFGDNWQWTLLLEQVEETVDKKKLITLLGAAGKAPEQYPDWA
jgi:Plasmid pRiA4b ORF-3-like protein